MNSLLYVFAASSAVLGAVLVGFGSFGWGISLWLLAISLSRVSLLTDVWTEYKRQDASNLSLYTAFVICIRRMG